MEDFVEQKEPKIVERPAFIIVGKLYRGKNENKEIPQLWQSYGPQMHQIKNVKNQHICYGVMDNFDQESKEFDYVAAQEVSQVEDPPEGLVSWEIPECTYAVFTCTLPTISETFDYIYHKWLPASGYEHSPSLEFELYDERFHPEKPQSELDIYIPIKKK